TRAALLGLGRGDLLGCLGAGREHGDTLLRHLDEPAADRDAGRATAAGVADHAGLQRGEQRRVPAEERDHDLAARADALSRVRRHDRARRRDDRQAQRDQAAAFRCSLFARASSTPPTFRNACSGTSSILPSRISPKLLIVSAIFTYLPGMPVNCSATKFGWPRNFWILRARETTSLSSSESSSMPRIAMMSWSSLYFCSTCCTPRATR